MPGSPITVTSWGSRSLRRALEGLIQQPQLAFTADERGVGRPGRGPSLWSTSAPRLERSVRTAAPSSARVRASIRISPGAASRASRTAASTTSPTGSRLPGRSAISAVPAVTPPRALSSMPPIGGQRRGDLGQSLAQRQRCVRGAQRVVLVGDGRAERRDHDVPAQLADRVAVAKPDRLHGVVAAVHDVLQHLGIQRRPALAGADVHRDADDLAPARSPRRRGERADAVAEDVALQLLQLRRRVEPQLVGQHLPRVPVGGERVGLAPAAVERQHQLGAQRLAQRMLRRRAPAARPPAQHGGRGRGRRRCARPGTSDAAPRAARPRRRRTARSGRPAAPGPARARARRPAAGSRRRARRGRARRAPRRPRARTAARRRRRRPRAAARSPPPATGSPPRPARGAGARRRSGARSSDARAARRPTARRSRRPPASPGRR